MAKKHTRVRRLPRRFVAAIPTDEEDARRSVDPYREMTVEQRMEALAALLRQMDTVLAGRAPVFDSDFWRHWGDPSLGRPRGNP